MATTAHFAIFRGEDKTVQITLSPVVNITGWALAFNVRADYGQPILFTRATSGQGVTIPVGSDGVLNVALTSANTDRAPGAYVFDVRRTDSGSETALTEGTFTIRPGVRL